ncbi:RsiV family protein [Mycolicibacterium sp. 050232]|uniref:RsiV family protein n=1 Tax=Mycolicibacterium sp. 050232 TaxID=3113982 RepID=UPI002E2A1A42|nr:RsiV family protein [Mycolicibacterium sp. 050232]MED5810825.1 RsiV family protein [Mycolicibacterium sp. 050232]
MSRILRGSMAAIGAALLVGVGGAQPAIASDFVAVPVATTGTSPDGLGTWNIHYERADGGDPAVADEINSCIEDKVDSIVRRATWDGSTRRPWTFDAGGQIRMAPIAVSEIFVGRYDTGEANMPIQSVASAVCDSRTGAPITWDSLFVDKQAGLARLGDDVAAKLAATAPPEYVRDWRRQGQFAPVDINFPAWAPTSDGIELHFPEFQFGRGLKVVTVPWQNVTDLIRPEFAPMRG